jgi:tRNA(Ile)-lysidine synthase
VQVTVEPAYLERFTHALTDLGVSGNDTILLAVSGGPDSLALLLLANSLGSERIVAVTVDHGLRAESADEAVFVNNICKGLAVRHVTLSPSQPIGGNIQSSARSARYELLGRAAKAHDCTFIATAHHGDDQLETMLMRLVRGSGVGGMAGIRARHGQVIRPLLGFSKAELEGICAIAGIEPVRDPSNDNADFDRVAMRQWLAMSQHPFDIGAATRTAAALGDATAALEWMTAHLATERMSGSEGKATLDAKNLPRELQRRLLLRTLLQIEPEIAPRGDAIERLLADLTAGRTAMIGDIRCEGGDVWNFAPAPPRRTAG